MAYRSSAPDLVRPERAERWDRGRYEYERDRDHDRDRDRNRGRFEEIRERFEDDDDHVHARPPPFRPPPRDGPPPERRFRPRDLEEDEFIHERRRVVYDDEPPRRRPSPPPVLRRRPSPPPSEVERRVVIEKERYRSPSPAPPPRRPAQMLRRQSSLDTFDRPKRYWEREEYGPPARRDDYKVPPYVDIPLPRSKALPPPRVYAEREYYDEIEVSDPHRYGDDDFHAPGRVREKEVIRTRRRSRSRESRATTRSKATTRRGRSRSSSSSSSSSSGGTTLTAKSEYPKKGKTRIPARLVSKRALIDLGYPFIEEGKTIVVQKALGQQNIDDLLKLSDDYKKSELEVIAARSSAGDIIEERVEHRTEVFETLPAPPPPRPPSAHGTGAIIVAANPPPHHPVEVVKTTVVRDVSPARTYTTTSYDTSSYDTSSYDTSTTAYDDHHHHNTPIILEARPRESSGHVPVGPVALVSDHRHHRHRRHHSHSHSRSRHRRGSRDSDELRHEIRHLEKQLARRRSRSRGGELVRAERLSTGELVLYEEEVELVQEPRPGGARIERDKRGRLSISVPRRGF